MAPLTKEQIKEIAEELDCGFRCFWNKHTNELLFVPDTMRYPDIDTDAFKEDMRKIKKDRKSYIEIEPPESKNSFEIMAEFAEQLSDNIKLSRELTTALSRRKPFSEFKFVIDSSGEYRQKWFDYKTKRLMEWVEEKFEETTQY